MKKAMQILRHEVVTLVNRFSFWFGVLGVPAIAFLLYAGISIINQSQGAGDGAPNPLASVQEIFEQPEETRPQGYVDAGDLIQNFPGNEEPQDLIAYTNESKARLDLDQGKISAYYVIPADYVTTGQLKVYVTEFQLIGSGERADQLRQMIAFNLLDGDLDLVEAVRQPMGEIEEINLSPETGPVRDKNSELSFFLPYAVMMFFFIAIMGSAGMLLNSVAKEKENRIMEVLLMSATPHQILLGKVVGLGLVGLLQVLIWGASSFTLLRLSGQTFNLPPELLLDPSILIWGTIFFLLGYLIYAALLAGIGALVPSLREASQATMIITLPMMAPLFIISALIDSPNGALATGFSLFPLTASSTMMLRLASANVPIWQVLLSIVLMVLAALFIIRAVAGLFRAQTLLSGQTFNMKRFFLALLGKA